MKRETAWIVGVGSAALAATAAAGATVWSQYGALMRWQEPELELPDHRTEVEKKTFTFKVFRTKPLKLDIYYPIGTGPFPVALYAHGGAFVRGEREMVHAFEPIYNRLLDMGFAVVSVDYRLFEDGVYFPDNIVDISDALTYLKRHERGLKLDTDRIVAWGDSAGASLVMTVALTRGERFSGDLHGETPNIKAVVALYPPTNFLLFKFVQTWIAHLKFYEGSREEWRALMVECSPVTYLSADSPPILLLHGKKDPIVPFAQTLHFVEHAGDVGANVQLLSFPNGTHSLASFLQTNNPIDEERLLGRIERFIREATDRITH